MGVFKISDEQQKNFDKDDGISVIYHHKAEKVKLKNSDKDGLSIIYHYKAKKAKYNKTSSISTKDSSDELEKNLSLQSFRESKASIQKDLQYFESIPWGPIACPLEFCTQTITRTSALSHFIRDHQQKSHIDFREIIDGQRSLFSIDINAFGEYHENICLGILLYGGKSANDKQHRPALLGMCKSNSFLPGKYSYYSNHLPILVMCCKSSVVYKLQNKELAKRYFEVCHHHRQNDILVVWLATFEGAKFFSGTVTGFDQNRTMSRSVTTSLRSLKDSQDPVDFLSQESRYLIMNLKTLDEVTNYGETPIFLEVFVSQYD